MPHPHYSVYVIELSKDVLYEPKFKRCNPGYIPGKPCVYVGMTGLIQISALISTRLAFNLTALYESMAYVCGLICMRASIQ